MLKSVKWVVFIGLYLLIQIPVTVTASAYWMKVKGSGKVNERVAIRVFYGSIDEFGVRKPDLSKELQLTGDFKFYVLSANGQRQEIIIAPKKDCWEGSFVPTQKGSYHIIGINDKHPVVDRSKTGGINEKPVDYLCADYRVGLDDQPEFTLQYLDITTRQAGRKIIISAYKNSMPAAADTKLRVFNPENWEKELALNEMGKATFVPTLKGLYIIRQDCVEKITGNYRGIPYTDIRYRCNYCLQY